MRARLSKPSSIIELPEFGLEGAPLILDFLALTVSSILVNSVSVTLSALTSLDWQSASTREKKFLQQLEKVTHIHNDGSKLVLVMKKKEGGSS
jgi:hypothetical protein